MTITAKYRVVLHDKNGWTTLQTDDIRLLADLRGWTFVKLADRKSLRTELQGEPIYAELCGPMWDGNAIRYENQTANDILSA